MQIRKITQLVLITLLSSHPVYTQNFDLPQDNGFGIHGGYKGILRSPVSVDLDNDGDLDILAVQGGGVEIAFLENIGSPSLASFKVAQFNAFGLAQAAGLVGINRISLSDLDGDGDKDIWIWGSSINLTNTLFYYENTGNQSTPSYSYLPNTFFGLPNTLTSTLEFVDIDGDNDQDAFCNGLKYKNTGSVSIPVFTIGVNPLPSIGAIDVKFVDIDNDGDLDAFNFSSATNLYYENFGSAANAIYQTGLPLIGTGLEFTQQVSFGDLDGDGDEDALSIDGFGVSLVENIGTLISYQFDQPESFPFSCNSQYYLSDPYEKFITADIDTDGDQDLFILSEVGKIVKVENTGNVNTPSFSEALMYYSGNNTDITGFDMVDIDNDGDIDIIATSNSGLSLILIENIGTPSVANFNTTPVLIFQTITYFSTKGIDLIDLDGDNDFDVFVAGYDLLTQEEGVYYHENTGTSTTPVFTTLAIKDPFGISGPSYGFDFIDIDSDGDHDLFLKEPYNTDGLTYLENIGNISVPQFSGANTNPYGITLPTINLGTQQLFDKLYSASFSDLDGDGDYDLLSTASASVVYGSRSLIYYENTSNTTSSRELKTEYSQIKCYPNPNKGSFIVNFSDEDISGFDLLLKDISGKTVASKTNIINGESVSFLIGSGVYLIEVLDSDNKKYISKILVY